MQGELEDEEISSSGDASSSDTESGEIEELESKGKEEGLTRLCWTDSEIGER